MDIELREKNEYTLEMSVTVPWPELEESFHRAAARFSRSLNLPGFRRGKIPRRILLQKFRPQIEAEFAQQAVEEFYVKALEEKGLIPLNRANITNLHFGEGELLTFTAQFEVEPEVDLPNYQKKFKVVKHIYIPDEEDVDRYIEDLRQHYAELKTVETGSQQGHLLLVDMQELDATGVPIIGRKVEDRYIKIGDGVFGGANLGRLTDLRAGDNTRLEVESQDRKRPVKYELTVKNVQEEILPKVDNAFIKMVDNSASDEMVFRQNIMKKIQSRLDHNAELQFDHAISDYFVRNTSLKVPPSMVEKYLDQMVEEAKSRDGRSFDEEEFKEERKPSAIRNLRWYLIRKAIIDSAGLEVSDEQVEARIEELVQNAGDGGGQVRRYYRKPTNREGLRADLLDAKVVDHLREFVKVQQVKIYTRDLRKQQVSPLSLER